MATDTLNPAAGPWRHRRWLRRILLGCVALAGLVVGGLWLDRWLEDYDWRAACAEADRLDPGWRWADLTADRPDGPDGENAMLTVRAVCRLLPEAWPDWPAAVRDDEIPPYVPPPPIPGIDEQPAVPTLEERRYSHARDLDWSLSDIPSNQLLQPQQLTILRRILAPTAPALVAARRLVNQPRGRFPLDRQVPAFRSGSLQDRSDIRRVQDLLRRHGRLLAETDTDAAFSTVVPILNCSRLGADEPNMCGFSSAISSRYIARHLLELSLGRGEPSPALLSAVQGRIEEELGRPIFLTALRGDRAEFEDTVRAVAEGRLPPETLRPYVIDLDPADITGWREVDDWLHRLRGRGVWRSRYGAMYLRYLTRVIEYVRVSPEELGRHEAELAQDRARMPAALVQNAGIGAVVLLLEAERRGRAVLEAAVAVLAAERFRRDRRLWPATFVDLVPSYLAAVPTDPFDGRPLRMRRLADGLVIYSIGKDGTDDGGEIRTDPKVGGLPKDVGIRLWDPDRRGRPHAP